MREHRSWSLYKLGQYEMKHLVPERFWKHSGLDNHDFKVYKHWYNPYEHIFKTDGTRIPIPESAYCAVHTGRKQHQLLVPKKDAPAIFDAIIHLGWALRAGARITRYMQTYMAYERVVSTRNPNFSSIRHALSHATGTLTRPTTIATLRKIFGTEIVSLHNYQHLREFNRFFGFLLIELDRVLYSELKSGLRKWSALRFM